MNEEAPHVAPLTIASGKIPNQADVLWGKGGAATDNAEGWIQRIPVTEAKSASDLDYLAVSVGGQGLHDLLARAVHAAPP